MEYATPPDDLPDVEVLLRQLSEFQGLLARALAERDVGKQTRLCGRILYAQDEEEDIDIRVASSLVSQLRRVRVWDMYLAEVERVKAMGKAAAQGGRGPGGVPPSREGRGAWTNVANALGLSPGQVQNIALGRTRRAPRGEAA